MTAATATISLRGVALAALAAQLGLTPASNGDVPELHWLRDQLLTVAPDGDWPAALAVCLTHPAPVDAPLLGLAAQLGLVPLDLLAVALALAVERDVAVGRTLAYLQAPVGGSRPTLGLVAAAFAPLADDAHPIDALLTGAAVACGLLVLQSDGAPLPEHTLAVPVPLYLALHGSDGAWPGAVIGAGAQPAVPLAASVVAEALRQARGFGTAAQRALVLRSGSPAEGAAVAAAIAQALDLRPVFITSDQLAGFGPWLALRRLLPVFCWTLAPGERRQLPTIAGYRGPVLALCGPDGSVETAAGSALSWTLPVPGCAERAALWQTAVGDDALAETLAREHRHGAGRIAQLGDLARHQARLDGRARPTAGDVARAAWTGEVGGLDGLAQPLPARIADDALVLTPALRQDLETLMRRCRARDRLVDGLGAAAAARYYPGVRALFVGPSGTGKTLAAGWLATALGLPLYRVDLAAVTSKYIGETEKNLAQLLARAEQAEVVLLFDEADSLFGKRTDVKDANDRFANAQTNYLLQRIETFDGIAILTSNSRARFDTAFGRRLDLMIDFPLPGPDERRALWLAHLGVGHDLSQPQLNQLAAVADVGGGQIRNVVFTAAVIADDAARQISYADLLQSLATEYKKLGRQMPVELKRQ